MELTPKLLTEEVDFRVGYRGYDRDEVDDFLERVAVAVGQLQQQLADAVDRARTAEGRVQAAHREVEDARRHGPPGADPALAARESEDLNEELRRTLILAQRTADAAIREAREQASKISAEAEERAKRRVIDAEAEAHRKSDESRSRLLAEIAELEGIRDSFRGDVALLERHLEGQRQQLRSTVQQLQQLLDDPNSFRIEPMPPLSGVSAPSSVHEAATASESSNAAAEAAQPAERTAGAPAAAPRPATSGPQSGTQAAEQTAHEQRPQPGPPPNESQSSPAQPQRSQASSTNESNQSTNQKKQATGEVTFRGATPAAAASNHESGPQTQPISAARFDDDSDDKFLAELRRAMADEEPLGPRRTAADDSALFDQDDDSPRRPRFGRRR